MTTGRSVAPPGRLIARELEARGWNQQTLAEVMGVSTALVSEVINAKRAITPDTAALLASAFGTDAEMWLGLDARYRASLPKPPRAAAAERRQKLYAKVPVRAMIRRGWLPDTTDVAELERGVLAFTELKSLDDELVLPHAARTFGPPRPPKPEQAAWLCRARQLARLIDPPRRWRQGRVDELVGELCRLIMSPPALRDVPRILGEFGIRFVALERLPGMGMDGATFWLTETEPVIALSFTHDRIDNAAHTLLHEIDHVEHREASIDENVLGREEKAENELRADAFAMRSLVPQDKLDNFCARVAPLFSELKIVGFADLLHVHPGIIVGQLHNRTEHRGGLPQSHLRRLLVPVRAHMAESAMTEGWGRIAPVLAGEQE